MPLNTSTIAGIAMAGIHAPVVNFDTITVISTMPVAVTPSPLTTWPARQPRSRSVAWWRTMPICDTVNPVSTPTA